MGQANISVSIKIYIVGQFHFGHETGVRARERLREYIENFPTDGEQSEHGDLFGRAIEVMGDNSGAEKAWRDGTWRTFAGQREPLTWPITHCPVHFLFLK